MKRILATLLVSASISTMSAQDVLVGDMNGDNELTISDVTELVDVIMGKSEKRYIYSAEEFIKENGLTGKFLINGIENTFTDGVRDPYNGKHYVDLGLSVKWASMNVGANFPEENGDYFAWGETQPKESYGWSTYKFCNGTNTSITKYCTNSDFGTVDNKITLDLEDDAAHVNMGGDWRMPTKEEQEELLNKCYWEWTQNYNNTNTKGFIVYKPKKDSDIGRHAYDNLKPSEGYSIADVHIFLPSSGYKNGEATESVGRIGRYWSSSLGSSESSYSWSLYSYSYSLYMSNGNRYFGRSIRGVHE